MTSAARRVDCSGVVPGNVLGDEVTGAALGPFQETIDFEEAANGYISFGALLGALDAIVAGFGRPR